MGAQRGRTFKPQFGIMPGTRGILVSCFRNKEPRCVSEMYGLLQRASDEIYSERTLREDECAGTRGSFEDELAREISNMKSREDKEFLSVPMGDVSCLVFFQTERDPKELCEHLLEMAADAQINARFSQRVIPAQRICHANMAELGKNAAELLRAAAEQPGDGRMPALRTFNVVVESRLNGSLSKDAIKEYIAEMLLGRHSVDLKNPQFTVMVQVLKSVCLISVLENYFGKKKYNLQTLADADSKEKKHSA